MFDARTRGGARDLAGAAADTASVGLSLFPLGLSLGVLVVHTGLEWWWATVFSAVVYAGSLEFLLLGLVAAATPLAQIAVTAFLVNFRHVFYALSFPLHKVRRGARPYAMFALTDEAYALTAGDRAASWSGARIVWMQVLLQVYWVAGATLGAVGGALLPVTLHGLEFALTALFVVLALDAWQARRELPVPLLAAASYAIAALVTPGQLLLTAMALFTGGLLLRHVMTGSVDVREADEEPSALEKAAPVPVGAER
ncbi:4-azaleucine resistance transporter AzlC [Actinocorallia herbida]|uniref:4-azaleucine resistance transporter AzlC n=1 Tax=Actinocorallia herbida TaxID=58109 RepID=A0A3N1D478_9ACTN|nr:AzlC family ABC transporter permease [Actinocorallia herbida]ROO88325.1 4-azaleucine resistance transporter AzlC [Actinocorallia herbida]